MASSGRNKSLQSLDASFLEAIQGRVEPQFIQLPDPGDDKLPDLGSIAPTPEKAAENPLDSLRVTVSENGMEARLGTVPSGRLTAPVTSDSLLALLKKEGIAFGIDHAAIKELTAASRLPHGWQGEIVIARGQEPSTLKVRYPFLSKIKEKKNCLAYLAIDLSKRFQAETLDDLLEGDLKAVAVRKGEPLAVLPGEEDRQPGKDVFGLPRQDPLADELHPGGYVGLADDASTYISMIYGYLQFRNNRLTVVPPVWISPDKMHAYFIQLPQFGAPQFPTPEALDEVLDTLGIKAELILKERMTEICVEPAAEKTMPLTVKIAEGRLPQEGRDAEIELLFDPGAKAGAIRPDDTVDLRERKLVINAEPGQLLARKRLASKGKPGMNLLGEKMETRNGRDIPLLARQGVAIDKKEDVHSYIAQVAGVVLCMGRSLAVTEVYHVEGDVDYATGNLDVTGDLHIAGTIRPGFSVKCSGNVILEGTIESGASVSVMGDLTVKHGILGETTKIFVHGDLHTMFIQDAEVIVKGDLWVGSHIYKASIRSTGSLTLQRGIGTRGGRVVGGVVCAAEEINVSTIGSPGNRNTLVALQPDPQATVQLNKLTHTIRSMTNQVTRVLRALGLESLDTEALRVLLASVPPEKRKMYFDLLNQLNLSIKQKRRLQEKRKLVQAEMEARLQRAAIQVTREVYQGNTVQIGASSYTAERDMGPSTFRLRNDRIVLSDDQSVSLNPDN